MGMSVSRLRWWFAFLAIAIVAVVAGFYFYARVHAVDVAKEIISKKLGVEIQQSAEGFSLSKSEQGHTLFTVRASKAVQFKTGGRAELNDVSIIAYGRDSKRYDQIYGSHFEYDSQTGDVIAHGPVQIDLESAPPQGSRPDQAVPAELQNPIHLRTSGLVFNKNTGQAHTTEQVEFSIPQASGSAQGAQYDSKNNVLTLDSNIRVVAPGSNGGTMLARHGIITKEPRRAVLDGVRMERGESVLDADHVTVFLRDDNSIDHVLATGNVRTETHGATNLTATAPQAQVSMGQKNFVRVAELSGGVNFETMGADAMKGRAGRILMDFASNKLQKVHARENVKLTQLPSKPTTGNTSNSKDFVELAARAMDFSVRNGQTLERADTDGPAQIVITPQNMQESATRTVVSAAKFTAGFNAHNRIEVLHGAPDARVVSSAPGLPDRISTSREIEVAFDPTGGITSIVQSGEFQYHESTPARQGSDPSERAAWAEKATYAPGSEVLTLVGSPRIVDGGMTTTANTIRLNRRGGDAQAEGEVKSTYSELKQQSGGAMLATADPIHVTARTMNFQRTTGIAHYSGDARLWQGANIVQAPTIDFNRDQRSIVAHGNGQRVSTVLVQQDKTGKLTPVNVTAAKLTYTDSQRKAHFEGGVVVRGADATLTAEHVDVFLLAREQATAALQPGPSQVDRVVAEGNVVVQQPMRRGEGQKLVYTPSDGKFVLTGGSPSISDAQRGTVRGSSLTFYSRNDRVTVEGEGSSRTVTQTRVTK
jgi:lipopolysaccharide export system protein LptA